MSRLIIFLLMLSAGATNSTIVKLADLHTMAKHSDIVIHGYIGDQRVTTDEKGRLITLTDVEVVDALHGAKMGQVITIYQVGGAKDGVVMPLLGGQQYNVGNELFFFGLKVDDAFVSYGAGQGKLDVIMDNSHGVVTEDLGNVVSLSTTTGVNDVVRPTPLTFPNVADFTDELKLMVNAR